MKVRKKGGERGKYFSFFACFFPTVCFFHRLGSKPIQSPILNGEVGETKREKKGKREKRSEACSFFSPFCPFFASLTRGEGKMGGKRKRKRMHRLLRV